MNRFHVLLQLTITLIVCYDVKFSPFYNEEIIGLL